MDRLGGLGGIGWAQFWQLEELGYRARDYKPPLLLS
jgi:hypothetical protein